MNGVAALFYRRHRKQLLRLNGQEATCCWDICAVVSLHVRPAEADAREAIESVETELSPPHDESRNWRFSQGPCRFVLSSPFPIHSAPSVVKNRSDIVTPQIRVLQIPVYETHKAYLYFQHAVFAIYGLCGDVA